MENQNVTISVPKPLVKKAKIIAATLDKSLSEFFRETLEQKIRDVEGYENAKSRQLRLMQSGLNLGTKGNITIKRDELYKR